MSLVKFNDFNINAIKVTQLKNGKFMRNFYLDYEGGYSNYRHQSSCSTGAVSHARTSTIAPTATVATLCMDWSQSRT